MERDFRGFLEILRREGELVEVGEPVSLRCELAARVDAAERADNRAFLFRAVRECPGVPVAAGLYGSTRRHLLGLRMRSIEEFADRLDAAIRRPVPATMPGVAAPCQEVRFADDAGLDRLPIPTLAAGDGGPYITAGVVTLRDGARRNAGVYRVHVQGPRRLTILTNRYHDGHRILDAALGAGRTVDVAIALGVDPAVFVSAFWPVGDVEEFGVAGALRGAPLALARALTVDLEVPAHAEIVIEGRIRPGDEEEEGPFADITGQITGGGRQPVIEVTAITTRRDPVFHAVLGFNSREHFKSRGNDFWRDYQAAGRVTIPGLPAAALGTSYRVHFPASARNFHAVVALRKLDDAQPARVIAAMFDAHRYLKRVVVVDDDIDPADPLAVEWAQATRVGRREQLSVGRGLGSRIDTSADPADGQVIRLGIDATVPMALRKEILGPGVSESSGYGPGAG